MGNVQQNGTESPKCIPEEPSWSLPSSELDQQWMRACMDEMFDRDHMRKSFHGPDMSMSAPFADGTGANDSKGGNENNKKESSPNDVNIQEAEALADAVACLAYPYDSTARHMTVSRLTEGLTRQCREEDPFTTTVAQRLHFLRCMHAAMVRAWPRQPRGGSSEEYEADEKTSLLNRVLHEMDDEEEETRNVDPRDPNIRRRRRKKRHSRGKSGEKMDDSHGLSHTVRMGLNLLFTLMDCTQNDEACTPAQYAQLMREIVPIVMEFSPKTDTVNTTEQKSADIQAESQQQTIVSPFESLPRLGVLDELCDFLYRASMGRKYVGPVSSDRVDVELFSGALGQEKFSKSMMRKKFNQIPPVAAEATPNVAIQQYRKLPVNSEERTQAMEALYSLACSRASLVDFLLCVKILIEDVHEHSDLGGFDALEVDTKRKTETTVAAVTSPSTSPTINHAPDAGERSPLPPDHQESGSSRKLRLADGAADGPMMSTIGGQPIMVPRIHSVGALAAANGLDVQDGSGNDNNHAESETMAPKNNEEEESKKNNNNNNEESRSPRELRIREQCLRKELKVKNRIPNLHALDLAQNLKALCNVDGRTLFKAEVLGGLAEEVEMWSCGQNSYGELAHGDTNTRKYPKKAAVLTGKNMVQVAAGNEHTVVLAKDGKVYAVGYNDNGQCGQGNTGRVAHLSNIEALNGTKIVQVHAYNGCEHTLCVTSEGGLYSFGYNYRGQLGHGNTASLSTPQLVPGFGMPSRRVKYVSCSYYHSAVATDGGELFTFGRNDFGQLGLGDTIDRKEPSKVEGISEPLAAVACGQYHTVVAAATGAVYACGKNDYGQLGLKLPEPHRRITLVRFFDSSVQIKDLRCGYYHTIALSRDGKLWSFGRNDYGQLGIGSATQKVFTPREVEDLDGKSTKISRIAAGCYHSIAVDDNSTLYVFGRNNHGQLGCGESTERHSPWPMKTFANKRIADVAAGFYHTIILTGGEDEAMMGNANKNAAALQQSDNEQVFSVDGTIQEQMKEAVLGEKEVFQNGSGKVSPLRVALLTLFNLDRLGISHRRKQEGFHKWRGRAYPALNPQSILEKPTGNDKKQMPRCQVPYCIDSDPRTFALLVFVAKMIQKELLRIKRGENVDVSSQKDDPVIWSYMMISILRLIRGNVAQLLWSGNGVALQREMALANQQEDEERIPPMVRSLYEIHKFALDTIEDPPAMYSQKGTETVQGLASQVLMTGLELFYPTQELQVQLLASLMAESADLDRSESESPDETAQAEEHVNNYMRFSPRSPLMKFQTRSTTTPRGFSKDLRRFLLEPLLKRLANDELVSAMVPYSNLSSSSKMPTTPCSRGVVQRAVVESENTQASVALLSSLLSSLVRQVFTQATREIRTNTALSRTGSNGFLQLLLSLQKHLLSWAADYSDANEETSQLPIVTDHVEYLIDRLNDSNAMDANSVAGSSVVTGGANNDPESEEDPEACIFEGFVWKSRLPTSSSWGCLLKYAELVFRKCNEELEIMLLAEPVVLPNSQNTVVSGILPSLVIGLSLFSQRTFFATRLLPRVVETLQLLDQVCKSIPSVIEADVIYGQESDRFGFDGHLAREQQQQQSDDEKDEHANKKRVEEAAAMANLPWILQVEKSLAALGGRLASACVVGRIEGENDNVKASGDDQATLNDSYVMWRDSFLLARGLDPRIIPRSHAAEGLPMLHANNQSAQQQHARKTLSKTKSLPLLFSLAHHDNFIQNLLTGTGVAKDFIDTLRATYAKRNFAYNVTLIQGRGNGGLDALAMEKVERCIVAAILKHSALVIDAISYADNVSQEPPARLEECWKAAAEVRMHLVRLRSQFMANEDEEPNAFQAFCTDYMKRAQFLLLFSGSQQISYAQLPSFTSSAGRHWKVLQRAFWTMVRWKRVTKEGLDCKANLSRPSENMIIHLVIRFVKCPTDLFTLTDNLCPSSPTKKASSPTKRRKQLFKQQYFSLGSLFLMIFNNYRRGYLRASGLNAFRALLGTPALASPRADILRYLAPSLRLASLGDGTTEDLEASLGAVGESLASQVRSSFLSLYEDLATALKNALMEDSMAGAQERLLLLDSWAMTAGPIDIELLSRTGLLKVLQTALKIEELGGNKEEGDVTSINHYRRKQIGRAAWLLFRLLLAQVGGGADETQVGALLQVLYTEMSSALEVMAPNRGRKGDTEKTPVQELSHSVSPGANKHVKEFVGAPIRLASIGGSMCIPEEELLSSEEFSITLWVYIDSTMGGGVDRILFMRGDEKRQFPIVSIRDIDGRIECYTSSPENGESERIISKRPVPINTWTHVALVVEAGKLVLFVQGSLDSRQPLDLPESTNSFGPLYIGKHPKFKAGIEGFVSQVKYHSRALSPIHLHIMCDQGPPKHVMILDRHCFQLLVVQQTLTENNLCRQFLGRPRWLELHAKLLKHGTPRVQQAVLRLWRVLFPLLTPREVAPSIIPVLVNNKSIGTEEDLIDYLLAQIGVGVWSTTGDGKYNSPKRVPIEEEKDDDAKLPKFKKKKKKLQLKCDTSVGSMLDHKQEDVKVQTSVIEGTQSSHHSFALSSELIMLVRLLSTSSSWKQVLSRRMTDAMSDISCHLFSPTSLKRTLKSKEFTENEEVSDDDEEEGDKSIHALRSVGTLAVLGGHTESIRVGGKVAMTHADITATVVSFDPSVPAASSALVVMTPVGSNKTDEDSQEEKQNSETEEAEVGASPTKRSLKAVRMNTDELVPIPEFRSPFASLSPKKKKKPIVDVVMPHAEHEEVTKVKLEDSFYRLLDHLFVSDSPRPCSSTKTVLLAQCRARTLKVLHEMLQAADSNLERLFLERDDKIIASILSLSSRIIKRENFFTLDGMEVRAIELRKRLHQLLVDKQSHPYSCYSGTTSPDEGESKVEPVADLTVDVEESFSDIEDEDETEAIEEEEEADTEEEDEDYQVNVDLCSVGETAEEKMNALMYSDDEEDEDEDEDEDEEEDEEDEDHILDKDVNSPPMYLVEELMAMGFPEEWCVIALRIQGLDLLAASTWIVDNLDMLSSTPIHELTQGPSGAASPPSRVGSRAVSHDPDAQEEHKLEDSMETHQEEQRKQQEQQMLKKKKREADKRLARAKASVKNMNESFQQLEEELGLEVFAENSFRTDSSPSYGYGYVCGALGLYNGLHAEGTRNESSRESFRAEISLLNYEELQSMCIDMEDDLSILYARSCLVVLLQRWRQWPHEATSKIFNAENKLFLQLLKLVLFRGPQIMPSYEVSMLASRDKNLMSCDLPGFQPILAPKSGSLKHLMVDFPDIGDGCNNAFPAPPGSSSTSSSSTTKNNKTPPKERNAASGAASSVMNLLVQAVQPAVEQMVRYELGKNSESLVSTMVECALSDLELAANSAQYVDTEWGIRDLFITDKDVGNKANVEFSTWLMGLVQSEGSTSACSVQTFSRISSLLGSPNVPLKSVCCQLLCGILRTWLAREAITPQQHDAVAQLPYERLFAVAEKRAQLEQRCGRVFLSKYVSSSVELLFLRNKFDIHEPAFETIENAASIQEGTIEVVQGMRITKVDTNTITCVWHLASGASVKGFSIQLDDEPPVSTTAMRHTFSSLQPNTSYSIRVIASMESGETSCASVCKCKTLDDILFTFDSCNCGPSISISEKGLSASFSAMESWSTVLGSEGFTSGVAQWQIRIDESESPYMFVGVATRKACLTTFLGGDEHGWGYIGDRALYHKRNRVNVYGERFGQGDIIGVVLDMDQGTLSFNKNGKDLGVAIEGLSGRLYPAFAFYSGTQSVSLLRKSIKTTVADREPYYGLDNVLDSYGVLEDFAVRNCSKSVLQAAYKIYQDWMRATKFRAQTKLGHELDFERAKRHGQRIQTTLGTGTVLGTRNDKVWILYDEDPTEAWFCEEEDIVVLSDETIVNEKPHDEISFETFLEFADDKKWTLTQDQAMIAEMGSLCARRGKNPFNISMATFMSDVLPPAKMRARGSANRDKDDLTRKFEGNMDNPQMAAARVSVLKVVNGHMETALPFVGIGFGTSKIHSNVISTVFDKDSNQDRLLIANLPQKFRNIRGILFSHTKRNVLSKMLHVSATVPKRAEDDYDYPEELPQLVLNRPKASFSRSLPDAESRLSFSLFGQAFDELHFLDPSSLRIAYSHPMDEGQSRSFKVKFEGEGVDDYGGPYREVFTQWSAELSSTTWSQDGAAEDETPDFKTGDKKKEEGNDEGPTVGQQMVCVLPLLHPCPNRQHGVGTNREKFILRPHTAGGSGAHLLMEMYNFLGQLGGIALRTKTNLNIDLASMVWKPLVGESLTVEDLRDIDHSTVAITERLEQMEMCEELRWTTNTSDGTQVELFPGGAQEKVTSSNCKQYAHVLLQTRLRESESAIAAVRDGLTSVIPSTILPLFTWEELERCVCGIPEMDVGLLKQCTEYDDDISPNDSHIQSFWRVLESFSNVHRQRFLRFVWARSRLPATAKEFPQKFKVQAPVGEGPRENPDEWLPKAHTCFFALSLPRYTSDEVMKEKLLYAIQNCLEMDADFRLTETEMTGWDDQQVTSGTGPTLTIQT